MLDLVHPGGSFYYEGRSVKANPTFSISFWIESTHKVFPFFLSIILASATDIGSSIPYLCEHLRTLEDTADTMTSRFYNVCGTHRKRLVLL